MTPRLVKCDATPDYRLRLRFEDGLECEVHLGRLLELGAFAQWRDVRLFLTARPDNDGNAIVWRQAGVRLDIDIFYAAARAGSLGVRRAREVLQETDPGFARFMLRALMPLRRRFRDG